MPDLSLSDLHWMWIRRILNHFISLAPDTKSAKLKLWINEREKISDRLSNTSCKLCISSCLDKGDLMFALARDSTSELFHALDCLHRKYTESDLSILFEICNVKDNKTSMFSLHRDYNGSLKIVEKTKNKLRNDGANAALQVTGIMEAKDTRNFSLKIHDFLYKIRAFDMIESAKFSASVANMDYSTEFAESSWIMYAPILCTKSHYVRGETDGFVCSSSGLSTITLPTNFKISNVGLSVELLTTCFDQSGIYDSPTCEIYLYFFGLHGIYDGDNNFSSSALGSIFPFIRLGITINDVEPAPESKGLLTPDVVLLGSRPNNFPNTCIVVLRISCTESTTANDRTRLMSELTLNFESILFHNAALMQAIFINTMRSSLDRYFQAKSHRKLSSDLEKGISLTVSSVRDVVSMSGNDSFRKACFSMFGVEDEHDLGVAMVAKLMTIADSKPESTDHNRKRLETDGDFSQQQCSQIFRHNFHNAL